ncbi:GIY-YIG nuclease family protein [Mariniblastus sp.]|nr:GIY-YIG nuclease family protein [Mariniblastus sp.]MDB4458534.1 GIY-YIG nuclease family protein [bacterium]
MKSTPKTIQIFLPGGNPRGIRIAEITTRILQVIEVPRSLLTDFLNMPESNQVALYFLIGTSDDTDEPEAYIGQTGDLKARLKKHNQEKSFWERALVVISRTNSLTQTHALFLEWQCLQSVNDAGRYGVHNSTGGTRPHTPAPMEADCYEVFETASTLLATLGCPLFTPLLQKKTEASDEEDGQRFYCTGPGVEGKGIYGAEGFIVLKGSFGRSEDRPSLAVHSYSKLRPNLVKSGVCSIDGDKIVFEQDHLFGKPSKASAALYGRSSNGWTDWKTKCGKNLDEVIRQAEET